MEAKQMVEDLRKILSEKGTALFNIDIEKCKTEDVMKIKDSIMSSFNKIRTDDDNIKWENILAPIIPDDAIPLITGYSYFDNWQTIRKKRTTCFIGKTNSGKTFSLINLAAALTRKGYRVAYLSFEVERQDIRIRILSQLFGISQDKIKVMYDYKELHKLWEEKCKGLKMPEVFSDSYNTYDHNKLVQEIVERETSEDFKFDAILIDYMSLLDSKEEQMYLKGKDISQAFARYSKSYNWAIITAAQVNRPGLIKIRLGMDDIAESAAMLHTFDFIISIIHNERLRDADRIAWELIKARYVNDNNRPGSTTSFQINWTNGGNYFENSGDVNEQIIQNIDADDEAIRTGRKRKETIKKDKEKNKKTPTVEEVVKNAHLFV
jgi:hypothetical protein